MKQYSFDDVVILHDKERIPLSAMERQKRQGPYRYYGAQGVIDHVDNFLFDGEYVLIAEDGENLKSQKQDVAQLVNGKFWVNNHAHIATTTSLCRLRYFYYLINSKDLSEYVTGSAQPKLSQASMRKMSFVLPNINTQDKILGILGGIDDKINENERINKNLFQQSQALYSAWFELFLPFGGSMPSDWRIVTLGDIATIKTISFNPLKNPGVMLEHYSIPAYDEQHFPVFESSDNVKSNKYILTENSVLASKLNPDTKRIWRPMCLTDHAVCSTEFIVFEANNNAHKDFLFSIIDSQSFSNWMCAHTTGSTNSRQRTTPSTTLEFKVHIAPDDVIDEFCASVTPMYDLISQNLLENQGLASLRDSLLPKLMSGEIDVSNIDL